MSVRTILRVHDRIYTDLVTVEVAEDSFFLHTQLAEHPSVFLKEAVDLLFAGLRIF
jgi:hypothetical protein